MVAILQARGGQAKPVVKKPPAAPARGGQAKPVIPARGGQAVAVKPPTPPRPVAPPAPGAPAPPAPPPPPPPPDFASLAYLDPEYITGMQRREDDNTTTTAALRRAFLGNTQSAQDQFNAHGALFSGAAQNAQQNIAADSDRALAAQKLSYDRGGHDIWFSTFQRLMDNWTKGLR